MLEGMRKASQGWAGRILMALVMGFISLSFAIWGVGDIFRGTAANTVAKVGSVDITADAYRAAYQTQLQQTQRQTRQPITNDQARAMGIDQQVLGRLVSEALLDGESKKLGLAMADREIAKAIVADPSFAGGGGTFDQARFNDLLRDNGYTEASFVREQRRVYLRREIAEAIAGQMPTPRVMLEAVNRFRNETRSIDYLTLPAGAAGDVAAPTAEVIQKYYEARRLNYRAPAYRKLVTLSVTPGPLTDVVAVSDADAQALYEQVKTQRYGAPEKRMVEQVIFADAKAADTALEKQKAGATLAEAAAAANGALSNLGAVTRADIFDKAVADAAFRLPAGATSDPIKGPFGTTIVHVVDIAPESVKPFSEVRDELKREIAGDRARKLALALHDKIEDARTSGKSLAEAAEAAGLTPRTIEAIDQSGRDPSGAEVPGLVERDNLLKAAFASDIGVDNDTLSTRDGGTVWFEVVAIDPARERSLEDVRPQVEAAWRDDEIAKRLSDKAAELVKRLDGGESIEDVAKSQNNLSVDHTADVKRLGTTSVPPAVANRVFAVPVGGAGSAEGADNTRIVFKVLDSVTPPIDENADATKTLETQMQRAFSDDLLSQYLAKLQADDGVSINQAALRIATGSAEPSSD